MKTLTHEDEIKAAWRNFRGRWDFSRGPVLWLAKIPKIAIGYYFDEPVPPHAIMDDVYEFRLERGTLDGRPAERVVCDGVTVSQRFL